jgi:hypothetical protein
MSNAKVAPKRKTTGKVKKVKTSRVAKAIKVLNASVEGSIAEEIISAEKRARRKKASSATVLGQARRTPHE